MITETLNYWWTLFEVVFRIIDSMHMFWQQNFCTSRGDYQYWIELVSLNSLVCNIDLFLPSKGMLSGNPEVTVRVPSTLDLRCRSKFNVCPERPDKWSVQCISIVCNTSEKASQALICENKYSRIRFISIRLYLDPLFISYFRPPDFAYYSTIHV